MKFLVTGCGRSGTAYFNKLLNNLGIKSAHERIFDPKNKDWDGVSLPKWDDDISEVAWEAVPFLGRMEGLNLIHLIRNPIDQINSLKRLKFFENNDIWCQYLKKHYSGFENRGYIELYMAYWWCTNKELRDLAYENRHRYSSIRIEKIGTPSIIGLFQHFGIELDSAKVKKAISTIPETFNTSGDKSKDTVTFESLPECEIKDKLHVLSKKFGYDI